MCGGGTLAALFALTLLFPAAARAELTRQEVLGATDPHSGGPGDEARAYAATNYFKDARCDEAGDAAKAEAIAADLIDDLQDDIRDAEQQLQRGAPFVAHNRGRSLVEKISKYEALIENLRDAVDAFKSRCPAQLIFEPYIAAGGGGTSFSPRYDSTGGQEPFEGNSSDSYGQVCGGASIWSAWPGATRLGIEGGACSGGSDKLFALQRHGTGDVELQGDIKITADFLLKAEAAISQNLFVSAGVGLSVRHVDLEFTSDQRFFGGDLLSTGESVWQTGGVASAGVSTFVCAHCMGGAPLRIGVDTRVRFYGSETLHLDSPFGFTEFGDTGGHALDWSVQFRTSVPLELPVM
jgi:hypothetical protein